MMKKGLYEFQRFILDSVVAYLTAVFLLLPFFNVVYLRSLMKDSIKLNKIKKKYLKK